MSNVKDKVLAIWPSLSDEEIDRLLWGCTAYPACSWEHAEAQIIALHKISKGDFAKAFEFSMMSSDYEWEMFKLTNDEYKG